MPLPSTLRTFTLVALLANPAHATPPGGGPEIIDLRPGEPHAIQRAIDRLDPASTYTLLRLAPGTYREKIVVPKHAPPFKLLGGSATDTRIVWGDSAETEDDQGKPIGTFRSATVTVDSTDFAAENVCFENDHGPGIQAVAMSVGGDRAVFRHCRFLGWQDTLLVRQKRQFFSDCEIAGSVDFIFGASTAWFERCRIHCRDNGYITAASTPEESEFGLVFSECTVTSAPDIRVHLGRPWRPHAHTLFLECELPATIRPEGWDNWREPDNEKTARYGEWRSSGPGAKTSERVKWARGISDAQGRGSSRPWRVLHKWDPDTAFSPERISRLPEAEQAPWWAYLGRSRQAMNDSRGVLREELKEAGLKKPKRPADHGKPPSDRRDSEWFRSNEARELAAAVASFQTPAGAWSKAIDYTKGRREPGMQWSAQGGGNFPWHYVGTIDNGATTSEIRFLARHHEVTGNSTSKQAVLRGLEFMAAARYPNGGWPQVWPLEGGYHDHVTYNDDAMIRVLELLDDVVHKRPPFGFVDARHRQQAKTDLEAGIECLLNSQTSVDGTPAVWCAQHEPLALAAAGARMQEPAALSSYESVGIVRFLQKRAPQDARTRGAVKAALDWFRRSAVSGIRRQRRDGRNFYDEHSGDAGQWWGRFHDLDTNRPLFPGSKDGGIYDTFADMFAGNPTEYQYYTNRARSLLDK